MSDVSKENVPDAPPHGTPIAGKADEMDKWFHYKPQSKWKRHVEMRYVVEYVEEHHGDADKKMVNVRLGPLKPRKTPVAPDEVRLLSIYRRWCDALVIYEGKKVVIIEAKILPNRYFAALAQLPYYRELFKQTPEFKDYWEYPIECELVVPLYDPIIEKLCQQNGIKMIIYRPPWVVAYLRTLPRRLTSPSHI